MGIPYSKQINAAFDQVNPLVASTLDVLHTTQYITYLLAAIQILTAILQFFTVLALLALLITVNPDLHRERVALVTPVLQYLAAWVMPGSEGRWWLSVLARMFAVMWLCGCAVGAWSAVGGSGRKAPEDIGLPPVDEGELGEVADASTGMETGQ
ncbi:hypothetical protein LTR08_003642 [Meristemomyces frigidus]|nr:hypothetical protein LTR08_003642 [Meristemomyces frigidus]